MAETTILLAQAESSAAPADAVQNGVVVQDSAATPAPAGEVHATTEAEEALVFPPFDATTFASQLLWFALAFGVLYVLMSRVALPQIGSIIDKRKARIDGDLKEAERLRGETDKAIAAYEAALAEARKNAHGIAEETRTSIKADLEGKRKGVEDDLSKKVAEAEARILKNKDEALGRVSEIAEETAAALVTQLTGEANAKDVAAAVAEVVKG
ncbi:MAG: F0F1 ATP synthase subunit B [Devosia nanyangense]|uniref:ATP synthase subunit b n=1 Tax=Devosia nanyangense TaxID=1228055 RepID=A0A933NZA2_9HYPH|nr:F0F1 ATP synthase subunit B [Devosia nanyangense]